MNNKNQFRMIMHISLDSFFSSVEQALKPQLRDKAVVVSGSTGRNSLVVSPNYQARAYGIKPSMPLHRAEKIAPQAEFITGSLNQYQQFSEEFYKILSRYTDKIEPITLDEAYLDLTSPSPDFISPEHAAKKIKNEIFQELEIPCSIGIASNKVCAKVASQYKKPDALIYVPRGQEKQFLASLPLSQLPGIGPRTAEALKKVGLHSIGHLAKLSHHSLIQTFGDNGQTLWQMANGLDKREVITPGQTQSISRSMSFEFPTQDYRLLNFHLYILLADVCRKLRNSQKQAKTIFIKIQGQDYQFKFHQKTNSEPTSQFRDLYYQAKQLLQDLKSDEVKIKAITIGVGRLSLVAEQSNIFEYSFYKQKKIQQAIYQISQRFGVEPNFSH